MRAQPGWAADAQVPRSSRAWVPRSGRLPGPFLSPTPHTTRGLLLSLGPECTGGRFPYPHHRLPQHPTLPSSLLSVSMETHGEGMALPRETHGRPLEQQTFTSRGLVPGGRGQVPAWSGPVRSLFLVCSLLAVSSQGRSGSSGLPLFSQGHESRWGPTLMTSVDLATSQSSHLQTPSHWGFSV